MKQKSDVFFNSSHSYGRLSSGLYQPIDYTSLLGHDRVAHKTESVVLRRVKTMTAFMAVGFLIGGVMGELYVGDNLQYGQFEFMTSIAPLLHQVTLPLNTSMIFSAALIGTVVSSIAGFLSFAPVAE